ncbi:MAG: ABC transporter permease [Acidobacteriota bacterium]|jgi:putative ABC transport system permease protein|nr:ABC transporter permease [Acidobacteriota bacterium]
MISQILAVTSVNLRSIPQRLGSSAVAVFGIVGVVIVFVGVLSIAEGFRSAMQATGDENTVMVMRSGADSEMTSGLGGDHARIIQDKPGIARDAAGPLASPELLVIVNHPLRRSGTDANVPLRGVEPAAFRVHPDLRIIEGRKFEFGRNEIIVGRAAAGQFVGLSVGSAVKWGENTWQVVGIFETGGSAAESELWCDAKVLQPAYRRGNSYQSVYARLESHAAFDTLKDAVTTDPRLSVTIIREPEYYARQSQTLQRVIRTIGFAIAGLMGIGAIFGAVNTMYNAVASRGREIATLRALGFGSVAVVISVLAEAVALSLVGGLIGGLIAWVAFDGYQTSTMNFQSFSQVAFAFAVTPALLARGLFYAVIMGVLGGLLPALRAARLPIVTALRQL